MLVKLLLCRCLIIHIDTRVVSEVEVLRRLNDRAHPLAKVLKRESTFSFFILVDHQRLQILIVESFPKLPDNVLSIDKPVVILVQVQEGFP